MRVTLLAVGHLKEPAIKSLFDDYKKRLTSWSLDVIELPTGTKDTENTAILKKLDAFDGADIIACDERGKALTTRALSERFQTKMNDGISRTVIVIGGADGLSDAVRTRASLILGLGSLTWPHMLVRALLAEQMYRCQQILSGHPYHRD